LLRFYPRAFRREQGQEFLAVLVAGAEDGRWGSGLAASVDLVRGGLWMRLRAGAPRSAPTVFVAVRLMYVGAAVEACTMVTIVATLGSMRQAIVERNPHYTAADWHAHVVGQMVPLVISAALAIGVGLWIAWANGRGRRWARVAFAAFFVLNTVGLLRGVSQHAATYAPADLIAGSVLCLVALATVVLIFNKRSRPHYGQPSTN
jgi:hypothetical protein